MSYPGGIDDLYHDEEVNKRNKDKDVQQVGLSVYIRKKVKQEEADGRVKTKTYWILEGKAFEDKEFVWEERRAREGHIQYRSAATAKSTRTLPDLGPTQSTMDGRDPVLSPKRVKLEPREGWTQEKKGAVQSFVKKRLSRAVKDGLISQESQKTLVKNVADKYMSENDPFESEAPDEEVQDVLNIEATNALEVWVDIVDRLRSAADYKDMDFIDPVPLDEEAVLPEKPEADPPAPLSPFLTRATYLRDPYYYMRLGYPNPRRGHLEEELEGKLFFNQSLGEVKVLGAIEGWLCHPSDPKQNQPTIIAAVRDWVGAHCLAYIQYPSLTGTDHFTLTTIHPLTDHVEIGKLLGKQAGSDILRGIVMIDDQRHVLGFKSPEDHKYLDLVLKLAMCSMYGQGADNEVIVDMRAHSVEFAWNQSPPVPEEVAMQNFDFLMTATEEEMTADPLRTQDSIINDLRMFMLGPDNRDQILRKLVDNVKRNSQHVTADDTNQSRVSVDVIFRQLRILEEAVRYPAPTNDPFIHEAVAEALATLQLELTRKGRQADTIPWNIDPARLSALWKITVKSIQEFTSRDALPDVEYDKFCDPAPASEAAAIQIAQLEERRAYFEPDQLRSGIYLTALVYCGDEILTDSHDNLPCEVISDLLSDVQMTNLNSESHDFKWICRHGVDPNWADNIRVYGQVYENSGTTRFRARFIEAAKRLQNQMGRNDLGVIFDQIVVQREVQCMHIVTVLRLASKDDVPVDSAMHLGWAWRLASEVEQRTYLKTFEIRVSTRVNFMPCTYPNYKRWIYAAMQYKESMDSQLQPGVYIAFFGAVPHKSGFRVMVSETHRYLIPLSRIQEEFPAIEEWRWVQCLNEKKRRVDSFEFHTISTTITAASKGRELPTFRHRFLRALLELQQTVGREIEHIYDHEILTFDEKNRVKIIAVGERIPTQPPSHKPPPDTTAVCFKNFEMVENLYFRLHWTGASRLFSEALSAADAAQLRVCTPFAADEALRLDHHGALSHLLEIESMVLPLRWLWTLWMWTCTGYPTIVSEFEGTTDKAIVRGIESSVETAVANQATQQDINFLTAKSIAADGGRHADWDTLYVKLREVHRTMKNGYSQRIQRVPPKGDPVGRERTWDSDEESDDDVDRPPTVYTLDCTLEELIEKDGADSAGGPNLYFICQSIVSDIVELSLIESVDAHIVKVCGHVINDMINVIECTDAITNDAVVMALKEDAVEKTMEENHTFKKAWYDAFQDSVDDPVGNPQQANISDDEDDDLEAGIYSDAPVPLYQQGSDRVVTSTEQGVRVCLAKAMNSIHQCEQVLKVIASAQEVAELSDSIADYDTAVAKQVGIIKQSIGAGAAPKKGMGGGAGTLGSSPAHGPAASPLSNATPIPAVAAPQPQNVALIMLSSDYNEFPLHTIDVSRAASLKHASGKIRFPNAASNVLSIVADFLNVNAGEMEGFLRNLAPLMRQEGVEATELLTLAAQIKAPVLVAAVASHVYGTPLTTGVSDSQHAFTLDASRRYWAACEASLSEFSVSDWIRWEALGGSAVAPAMDVSWWGRSQKEAPPGEHIPDYPNHEGSWRQMYAETRVKAFLMRGASAVPPEELDLWHTNFGLVVEYLSLKDSDVGDDEIQLLASCCPNLRSIDLSLTSVTDVSATVLMQQCPNITDISVDGSPMTANARQRLLAFAAANQATGH